MNAHPSRQNIFADFGPKEGGQPTIIVGERSPVASSPPHLWCSIRDRVAGSLRRQASSINDEPPRRGKACNRRYTHLTVRLAKGANPKAALRRVRHSITKCIEALNPGVRRHKQAMSVQRRHERRAIRRTEAVQIRQQWRLSQSFKAAFGY